ncbi:MAG: hypothetical protein RL391_1187 [Actinomycetota bacterium]
MSELHDAPSMAQLVESVREWLERDVLGGTSGRLQFHARVAINMLSMVEREMSTGSEQAVAHAARLSSLGVSNDAELAAAIRHGTIDARMDDVIDVVRASVIAKLEVANPGYFESA